MRRLPLPLALMLGLFCAHAAHAQLEGTDMQRNPNILVNTAPDVPKVQPSEGASVSTAASAWRHDPTTVDCGCTYNTDSFQGPVGVVIRNSCSYSPRTGDAGRVMARWSRVLPMEQLALGRQCSAGAQACHDSNGKAVYGSACCLIIDPEFRKMTHDAWDWAPMLSDIEADRGTKQFTTIPNGQHPYGSCGFKIDPQNNTVEPAEAQEGAVGRILLYFHDVWKVPMSPAQVALYVQWSDAHPPTQIERERANSLDSVQKFDNPYYVGHH